MLAATSRLIALALVMAPPVFAFEPSGLLEIHVMSVRHTNAMLVVGPDGTRVLMDAGRSSMSFYLEDIGLLPEDPSLDFDFDYSISSHLDRDHIIHFDNLKADGYRFDNNYFNNSNKSYDPGSVIDDYMKALTPVAAPITDPPTPIDLGDGAKLFFLAANCRLFTDPFTDVPDCSTTDPWETGCCRPDEENDKSIAVLITYGDFDFLWAGDLSGANKDGSCTQRVHNSDYGNMETLLALSLTSGPDPILDTAQGVDVLHVSHHGADSATNSDWMNALRPEVAVISTGPSYGDPEPGVVDGVLRVGGKPDCIDEEVLAALVLQTDEGDVDDPDEPASETGTVVGSIIIETDGLFYGIGATGTKADRDPVVPDERGDLSLPTFFLTDDNAPNCPMEVTLSDLVIDSEWEWQALHSLSTEGSVEVAPSGQVTLQAGARVTLADGFQVDSGGELTVEAGVVTECSERWGPGRH